METDRATDLLARFFGPIRTREEAQARLRDAALGLSGVAVCFVVLALQRHPALLAFPLAIATPTLILLWRPSSIAAGCLMLQGGLMVLGAATATLRDTRPSLVGVALSLITLALAVRARRAISILRPNYLEAYMAQNAASQKDDQSEPDNREA